MRIALTLLSGIGYGGQTYFAHLLPALAAVDRENEYRCFVPQGHPLVSRMTASNVMFHEVVRPRTSAMERFRYEQFVLPRELRRHRVDLLYTAKNLTVFRAPCPVVIAIQNMEPFKYRQYENAAMCNAQSRARWECTKRSIARAHAIIALSNAVRDAVVERFPNAATKVHVVYNGNPVHEISNLKPQISNVPFLLTASKFVAYANQLTLVEAYAQLIRERPDAPEIHFAGGVHDRSYFARVQRRIHALGIGHRIRLLGLVPQDDLYARMRCASAFVFPSTLEACPITLLEAMACGAPIVASNVPPMPEICGTAAVYFDPRNPDAIASAIARLLDDAPLRDHLLRAGQTRVSAFTWERTARALSDVFTRVHAVAGIAR